MKWGWGKWKKTLKYFLNLEKRDVINKTIIRLENNRGQSFENHHDIFNECKLWSICKLWSNKILSLSLSLKILYQILYTDDDNITNTDQIENKFFIEDHSSQLHDDKEYCEGILTMAESTLKLSKKCIMGNHQVLVD